MLQENKLIELNQRKAVTAIAEDHLHLHREMLERCEADYNEELCMLTVELVSRGHHTNLKTGSKVHPTRESIVYAAALLEGGTNPCRAADIIRKVISLQDVEPGSTFGLWSYNYEEPLAEMSPPDWNWADFIGKMLAYIMLYHRDSVENVSPGITDLIRGALERACKCIIKRDASVTYTNICVMDIYCTIIAGELLDDSEVYRYGEQKLNAFMEFTKICNNYEMQEYNSPTYTMVAAEDIHRIVQDTSSLAVKEKAEEVNRWLWQCIGEHYHAGTRQWGGPQGRCYNEFFHGAATYKLALATDGFIKATPKIEPDTYIMAPSCPTECLDLFKEHTNLKKRIRKGFCYPWFDPCVTDTTYSEEKFTIGSFNRSELWNQIRPLTAYVRVDEDVVRVRVQVLHDFYDYSSANLHCVQHKANILGHVGFSVDRGDTHINLDMIDGSIHAKDMRLRVSIESESGREFSPIAEENGFSMLLGEVSLSFYLAECSFGAFAPKCEIGGESGKTWFDVVLYSGELRELDFTSMNEAYAVFVLWMTQTSVQFNMPSVIKERGHVRSRWETDGVQLENITRVRPDKFCCMLSDSVQLINGKAIEEG